VPVVGIVRRRVLVEGDVQGVFFRDECRKHAESAGVAGSARNRSDGRVEVVLEGDEAAVKRLVDWCRQGSSRAEVTGAEVSEEEPEGLEDFATQ
jgi:acylphosphatase